MRFHLDPVSRAFSYGCGFAENAQRLGMNRRPKRIEIYAVSNENALVIEGLIVQYLELITFIAPPGKYNCNNVQ